MHYYKVKLYDGRQFIAPIQTRNEKSCYEGWFSLMSLDYNDMPKKIYFNQLEYIIDERNNSDITKKFIQEAYEFKFNYEKLNESDIDVIKIEDIDFLYKHKIKYDIIKNKILNYIEINKHLIDEFNITYYDEEKNIISIDKFSNYIVENCESINVECEKLNINYYIHGCGTDSFCIDIQFFTNLEQWKQNKKIKLIHYYKRLEESKIKNIENAKNLEYQQYLKLKEKFGNKE